MVLSHLHFDHAGGLLAAWEEGKPPRLLFPNATYVVGEDCWQRALNPHPRDRASFIAELQPLLEASGRLERVQGARSPTLGMQVRFSYSNGHTPGLMLAEIVARGRRERRRVLRRPDSGPTLGTLAGDDGLRPQSRAADRREEERFSKTSSRAASACSSRTMSAARSRVSTRDAKGRFSTTDERAELIGEAD